MTVSAQVWKWTRVKRKIYVCAPFGENLEKELEEAAKYYKFTLQSDCVPVGPHALATMLGGAESLEIKQMRQAGMRSIVKLPRTQARL